MAYIDNTELTVEAIVTKKGREKLASGEELGITKFALGDDEIDYTLYDPNHQSSPDALIVAIPVTEACSDETQALKHKLVTLPKGTTQISIVRLTQNEISVNQTAGGVLITPSTSPSGNGTFGYTAVLADQRAGFLEIQKSAPTPSPKTILAEEITTTAQVVSGLEFVFTPNSNLVLDLVTTLTIYGNETGGSQTIPIKITYKEPD